MNDYQTRLRAKLEQMRTDGRIYKEVDGFYVFHPGDRASSFNGQFLRAIADYLAELNREWAIQIRMDMGPENIDRVRVTLQAEIHNVIDKKTLGEGYGGDLLRYLRQIEEEDGLISCLATDLALINAEELLNF